MVLFLAKDLCNSILNKAAKLIFETDPFLHIISLVKNPKWLPNASYIILYFSSSFQDIHKKAPLS